MKTCAFCRQEPPAEKFYDEMQEFGTCAVCQEKLIDIWEDKQRAIARYDEYVAVLRGELKPNELTPGY